jgi:hypothetical protein
MSNCSGSNSHVNTPEKLDRPKSLIHFITTPTCHCHQLNWMYEILLSNKLHLSLGYSQMRIQLEEEMLWKASQVVSVSRWMCRWPTFCYSAVRACSAAAAPVVSLQMDTRESSANAQERSVAIKFEPA